MTASRWAIFLDSILLLMVCFESMTSAKNVKIFILWACISLQFFKLLKGLEFVTRIYCYLTKHLFETLGFK